MNDKYDNRNDNEHDNLIWKWVLSFLSDSTIGYLKWVLNDMEKWVLKSQILVIWISQL